MDSPIAADGSTRVAIYSRRPLLSAPLSPPPLPPPPFSPDDQDQIAVGAASFAYTQRTKDAVNAAEAVAATLPQLNSRVYDGVWGAGPWHGEGPTPMIKGISEHEWALYNAHLLSADRTAQLAIVRETFLKAYHNESYIPPGDRSSRFRPRSRAGLRGARSSSTVELFRRS